MEQLVKEIKEFISSDILQESLKWLVIFSVIGFWFYPLFKSVANDYFNQFDFIVTVFKLEFMMLLSHILFLMLVIVYLKFLMKLFKVGNLSISTNASEQAVASIKPMAEEILDRFHTIGAENVEENDPEKIIEEQISFIYEEMKNMKHQISNNEAEISKGTLNILAAHNPIQILCFVVLVLSGTNFIRLSDITSFSCYTVLPSLFYLIIVAILPSCLKKEINSLYSPKKTILKRCYDFVAKKIDERRFKEEQTK